MFGMNSNLTEKEKALLLEIVNDEYQSGNPVNHAVWLDYIVTTQAKGGVLTSLQSKGFVVVNMVPFKKSDNKVNGITDSTVAITQAGFDALNS